MTRAVRIGLTGPIGCGKSQVARWLAALGAQVVDADVVARSVTAPGQPAHDRILARFGAAVTAADGTLDRAALGRVVFSDPAALRDLEAIVHPEVRPRILAAIEAADRAGAPAVVIEAIKLVEGGLAALCDEVWLVTCDPVVQRERLLGRGGSAAGAADTTGGAGWAGAADAHQRIAADADQRIAAQAGLVERLAAVATRVLDTSGSPAITRARAGVALAAALEAASEAARREPEP